MLNPSYSSLIKILNEDANVDSKVTSRYSIVIAAAKRARQIVGGADFDDVGANSDKAVSIAINEIERGSIKIVPSEGDFAQYHQAPAQVFMPVIDDGYDDFSGDDIGEVADLDDYDVEFVDEDGVDEDWEIEDDEIQSDDE